MDFFSKRDFSHDFLHLLTEVGAGSRSTRTPDSRFYLPESRILPPKPNFLVLSFGAQTLDFGGKTIDFGTKAQCFVDKVQEVLVHSQKSWLLPEKFRGTMKLCE
jgi:hypothetical protein